MGDGGQKSQKMGDVINGRPQCCHYILLRYKLCTTRGISIFKISIVGKRLKTEESLLSIKHLQQLCFAAAPQSTLKSEKITT